MPPRTQPKARIKEIAKESQRPRIYRAYLAEEYDGLGQEVLVTLSGSQTSGVYRARVSAGAAGRETPFEVGTPVAVFSNHGRLEALSLGMALLSDSIDGDNIIEGSIDGNKLKLGDIRAFTPFASSLKPVTIVNTLPNLPDDDFPEGATVVLTTDSKLYRNKDNVWTAEVPSIDLTGNLKQEQIDSIQFAAELVAEGTSPVHTLTSLPSLPNAAYPQGAIVFLTTDGKLYRNVSGSWTKAIDGADITANTIGTNQLIADSITAGKIAAGAISAVHIQAGAIQAGHISADAVTAGTISAGAINSDEIAANTISSIMIAADFILAHTIYLGGTIDTPLKVWDSSGFTFDNNLLGSWRAAGLTVASGRFIMEGMPLNTPTSNTVQFWDFTNRVVRADGIVTVYDTIAIHDGHFHGTTLNGAIGISSVGGGRIYFRVGGSWRYVQQVGGFTIPVHESICPICQEAMLPGEAVTGLIHTINADSSLHGYYQHYRCTTDMRQEQRLLAYGDFQNFVPWNLIGVGAEPTETLVDLWDLIEYNPYNSDSNSDSDNARRVADIQSWLRYFVLNSQVTAGLVPGDIPSGLIGGGSITGGSPSPEAEALADEANEKEDLAAEGWVRRNEPNLYIWQRPSAVTGEGGSIASEESFGEPELVT